LPANHVPTPDYMADDLRTLAQQIITQNTDS